VSGSVIAWGSNHKGCEGELAKTGTRFVLGALLVLAAAGTGGSPTSAQDAAHAQDTARTQDNCLAAPTGKTPAGSHWHYRTDPVKQTKCWYLKSDGEAAQAATAADGADAAGGPPRPAAAPPKAAADPANPAAHPRKPHQAARTAAKPQPAMQNPAAGQAGQGGAAWPDPQPQGANGPPQQATQGGAAWPDPQQPQGAAANAPWPDPPGGGASSDPATTSATPETSAAQDAGNMNPAGPGETADVAQSPASTGNEISGRMIVALAVALAIVGILLRWLLGKFFTRRRRIAAERREPLWETDDYVMPDALARGGHPASDRIDPERLDAEAKQALRKLLRTLERSAA
jgi:hypothetical protein